MSKLTVLQMNDSHGYIESHYEYYWEGGREVYQKAGGYARIASYINQVKKECDTVVLDNGDTLHGTYPAVSTKGEALIPVLNMVGLDGMTAHWEFAYGPEHFKAVVEQLEYPMLAINCYNEHTGDLVFDPFCIVERGGMRIGVTGIAATIVDKTMPDHFSKGIFFTLGNEELPGYIHHLKEEEKVDVVVVVSHLGYPQELQLAKEVKGIDVLLSGHTHNRLYNPVVVQNTVVIQSGCHGSFLGRLDLLIEDKKVKNFRHELVDINESIPVDPEVDEIVKGLTESHPELDTVVGYTTTNLTRNRVMESTMDNVLLQALVNETGTEVAFSNGWRYGAPVPVGPVTLNDIWNIIPTDPFVSVCEITGQELWDMMEENLERTFSRDPYQQMGGYVKRCFGLNVYFKIENPHGKRIQEFFINGNRVDKSAEYSACFVTTQGIPEQYGHNRQDLDITGVEAVRQYMEEKDAVTAELQGGIVPI
ncbi:MAG: bifunctional metallophosphatase/5'-nucleotidase [Candidatus Methanofastidiosia archaeon]|jgi:2',3'-cyclic-nucleotide 2'-phosphodiesterase (5'-nucleotidase family)